MNNWSLVPPFTTYVPPPFYPRHPDAMHAHPVGDLPLPAFDVAARSPRAASSPSDGDGEAKHKGCRDGAGRPTATSSVESALRELHHQLAATHSIFIAYYSEWQNDKAKISYAEKETLENLWQDMLQAKAKSNADEAKMFHAAGEKITRCMQQARVAADNSCFLDVPGDSYPRRPAEAHRHQGGAELRRHRRARAQGLARSCRLRHAPEGNRRGHDDRGPGKRGPVRTGGEDG